MQSSCNVANPRATASSRLASNGHAKQTWRQREHKENPYRRQAPGRSHQPYRRLRGDSIPEGEFILAGDLMMTSRNGSKARLSA